MKRRDALGDGNAGFIVECRVVVIIAVAAVARGQFDAGSVGGDQVDIEI
jgi:hypothetical protein